MFRVIFTLFVSVVVAYIFLASLSGCGSRRATSEITTEVETSDSDRARYTGYANETKVVKLSETTTVEREILNGEAA